MTTRLHPQGKDGPEGILVQSCSEINVLKPGHDVFEKCGQKVRRILVFEHLVRTSEYGRRWFNSCLRLLEFVKSHGS